MPVVAKILLGVIAALHVYFLYLEMFRWTHPRTLKAFGMTEEFAKESKTLAANQGLYNGFLAAGLVWSFFLAPPFANQVAIFFVSCVLVAGVYGGITANKRILFVQALPALIALAVLLLMPG